MTALDALSVYEAGGSRAELWRMPALRVFRYGGKAGIAEEMSFGSGNGAVTGGGAAVFSGSGRVAEAGDSFGGFWGRNSRERMRSIRATMGSTAQRLGEAVRLMREQGSRSDVDTGAIFEELERRLLAEIGAG